MLINLATIPGAFHLPRPNWDAIGAWIGANISEESRRQAWAETVRQWLETLDHALGGGYQIEASDNLLLLSPRRFQQTKALLDFGEWVLNALAGWLGEVVSAEWRGPLVVLLFADQNTYYDYKSQFYGEGEWGGSSGMCIRDGYVHVILPQLPLDPLQVCFAHELAHASLAHLQLPLWLEEGITQQTEDAAHSSKTFTLDGEIAQEIRAYWKNGGLGEFWWGTGFFRPDDGQKNSYALARILFQLLITDHAKKVPDFLRHARFEDAGV